MLLSPGIWYHTFSGEVFAEYALCGRARGRGFGSDLATDIMKFIEMTGKMLAEIVSDDELHAGDLESAGVHDQTIVRVNEHGDIEVRRPDQWDVIGGLLGNFRERIRGKTGCEWV